MDERTRVSVNEPFKVSIFEASLGRDTSALVRLTEEYRKANAEGRVLTNQGGWQSEDISSLGGEFDLLIQDLHFFVSSVADYLSIQPLRLGNMWINLNGYMDFNWEHTHPGSILSGVYYIKVPPNSGDIDFFHPAHEAVSQVKVISPNEFNTSSCLYAPVDDAVYVFPGWLRHRVLPNLNPREERISLAFNTTHY